MRSTQYARSISCPFEQPLAGMHDEAIEPGSAEVATIAVLSSVNITHAKSKDAVIALAAKLSEIGTPVISFPSCRHGHCFGACGHRSF